MSTTIDERVVQMQFDNKQFESNVQTTMSTLDKLKQSLNLDGACKGLEDVGAAAKSINMSGLTSAVETVHAKFSAMEVMAVTALANIANSAVNAGKKIISALTIDPIMSGFREYETQINSVQTILSNTQAHQKKVSQEAIAAINETAQASAVAAVEANEAMLTELKKSHKTQLREFEDLAEAELEVLADRYEDQQDALEDAIDEELKTLKKSHDEKLALYEEEYMEKLKVVDEERYAKLKAIDDEIDAINALTEAEDEAKKQAEQEAKLASLENAVLYAKTIAEQEAAEAKLAAYKEELARKQLLKEREEQIKQLELTKKNIDEEYDAIAEQIEKEYKQKVASETELYETTLENLKKEQAERKELLRDTYEEEKKLLQKQIRYEKEALQELQDLEIASLKSNHELALKNIQNEKEAQIQALQEAAGMTKASTLEDVNAALDELNKYADKTIYNFTEMTRNIGTFTAAGIDLETSVSAIKGIANLAAVSGSTSQQASTAMYQLSQALASGTVKLMDWNSVVNAGMGGQVFQDALKETARVHGIEIDKMIASEGSFRETLSKGWLTSDILTETLHKFTLSTEDMTEAEIAANREMLKAKGYTEDQIEAIFKLGTDATNAATKVKTLTQLFDTLKEAAQSGWTQSWEHIIGDFEEARATLTKVSEVIGGIINQSADARNEMLKGWKDLGGRTALINSIKNAFEGVSQVMAPIKEAFREIFPPTTSEQLYNITTALEKLTSKFKLSETQTENLKSTFRGLFAVLDICKMAFSAVWNAVTPLLGGAGTLSDKILSLTGSWGDWLYNLRNTVKETNIFNDILQSTVKFITSTANAIKTKLVAAGEKFKEFITLLKDKIQIPGLEIIHAALARAHERMCQIGDAATAMEHGVTTAVGAMGQALANSKFFQFLTIVWDAVKSIGGGIAKALGSIMDTITEKLGEANFNGIFDLINTALVGGLIGNLIIVFRNFTDVFEDVGGLIDNLKADLTALRGCLEAYQNNIKADTLLKIAGAVAILAASIIAISLIDSEKLTGAIGAISLLFTELMASMAIFTKMSGSGGIRDMIKLGKASSAMLTMSAAIAVLAIAMKSLGELDWDGVAKGLIGVAGLSAIAVASAEKLSKVEGKMAKGAASLVIFGAAINVLASACKDLSTLSWEELVKGLAGVGVLFAEIVGFLKLAKFDGKMMSTATGIVILSAAIKVLASACKDLSTLSPAELTKGLVGIGVVLAELVGFTKLVGNPEKMVSMSAGIVLIAASMKIFASAISDFGSMKFLDMGQGLLAMALALAEIAVAVKFMPNNMVAIGAGLVVVGAGLEIVADVLNKLGGMTPNAMIQAVLTLGAVLAELAIALNAMNGTLAGSAALLVASAALAVLAPALSLLGAMSWESIIKGLVALAGAFTVIGVAGAVLTPIVPTILSLAGAFALIGVGVLALGAGLAAVGAGLAAIAAGFIALAGVGTAGATAVVAALTVIITGVAGMIPVIIGRIGEGIVEFCKVLIEAAPVVGEAFMVILATLLTTIVESIPLVVEGLFELLASLLLTLVEYAPTIAKAAFDILLACLKAVADNISMVVQTAIDVVLGFIDGIAQKIPDVIQSGFNLLLSFIKGITDAIDKNTVLLVNAIRDLFIAILNAAVLVLSGGVVDLKAVGQKLMNNGLIKGINEKLNAVKESVTTLINKAKDAVAAKISEWSSIGSNIIQGLIGGIQSAASSVVDAARGVVSSALDAAKNLLGIHSPSRAFAEIGRYSDEGLIVGLESCAGKVANAAKNVGNKVLDGMSRAISGITDILDDDVDYEPVIRPVLDLTNVESGAGRLNALFSRTQAMSISTGMNNWNDKIQNGENAAVNGASYSFVQNNYSPKALSRVDIYRQTKNQFTAMKEVLA